MLAMKGTEMNIDKERIDRIEKIVYSTKYRLANLIEAIEYMILGALAAISVLIVIGVLWRFL